MMLRVRHPNTPPRDVNLGPAVGVRHPFDAMRRTVDDQRAWEKPSHPIHNVGIDRR